MSLEAQIRQLTIVELARSYRSRDLNAVEVTEALLNRIDRVNPDLGAYEHVAWDLAMRQAHDAERELARGLDRGPLHGVPIAFKDIFFSDLMPTTAGMIQVPRSWRTGTSTVLQRALTAGAVVLGTVVTTEGVFSDYNPQHRAPRNPWDIDRWPGASSSGPGIAVASGLAFGAWGSDTGGSIRFPAAALGVTGLKPTWGRVSRFGVAPLAPSLDHVGPLAKTAADVKVMLGAVEGYDPLDPTSSRFPPSSSSIRSRDLRGLRVGIDPNYVAGVSAESEQAIHMVLNALTNLGCNLVEIQMPDHSRAQDAWDVIVAVEAAAGHANHFRKYSDQYGRVLADLIRSGLSQSAQSVTDAEMIRTEYKLSLADVFGTVDVCICPVLWDDLPSVSEWGRLMSARTDTITKFTSPFNLAGTPTITIPVGLGADGLPRSAQLLGGQNQECLLIEVATAVQSVTDWHRHRPAAYV
ncbi:amidase [Arthrobacter sp. KNU40]|uniref:amidase n=1 Tax=Arthrobacter sp. KNU40 TaxID=3447965 RepID=UPI003F5DCEFE